MGKYLPCKRFKKNPITVIITDNNLTSSNQTSKMRPLINLLFSKIFPHGVSQLVTVATRSWNNQQDSGLDHLYSNRPDKLSEVQVKSSFSDHKLLYVVRYAQSIKKSARYVTKRSYLKFCPKDFLTELKAVSWWDLYQATDVSIALNILTKKLTKILDKMAPIRKIQVRTRFAPWLSSSTKEKMSHRDELQEQARQTKNPEDWNLYKKSRNKVNSILKNEKSKCQKSKLQSCDKNPGQTWKYVKGWLNWKSSGSPTQLFYNGSYVTKPHQLAETMNNFFIDKIIKLKNSLPAPISDPLNSLK